MINKWKTIGMAACMILAACNEEQMPAKKEMASDSLMTITVGMPEESKGRIAFNDETLTSTWESGDKIYVVGLDESGTKIATHLFSLVEGSYTKIAKFSGTAIEGAVSYRLHYKPKLAEYNILPENPEPDENGDLTLNYDSQKLMNTSMEIAGRTMHLSSTQDITQENLNNSFFRLEAKNSMFCFEIESLPDKLIEDIEQGAPVNHVLWTNNYGMTEAKTLYADFYTTSYPLAPSIKVQKLYFNFYPEQMKLNAEGVIALEFYTEKGHYTFKATSAKGKEYQPGMIYRAKVSANPQGDGYLDVYAEESIDIPDNQIWLGSRIPEERLHEDFIYKGNQLSVSRYIYERKDGQPITEIPDNFLKDLIQQKAFQEIELPKTVTKLGKSCFQNCGLEVLKWKEGIQTIGDYALADNRYLGYLNSLQTVVHIPASVSTIGEGAFQNTYPLDYVFAENSKLQTIGKRAFRVEENNIADVISKFIVPASVTSLQSGIIDNHRLLKNLIILAPKGTLKLIATDAFPDNTQNIDLTLDSSWKVEVAYGIQWRGKMWKSITFRDADSGGVGLDDAPGFEQGF